MTDDVRAHLFEPFFTTKGTRQRHRPRPRDGLRRGSAERRPHRGPFRARRGTTFKIYLPAVDGGPAAIGRTADGRGAARAAPRLFSSKTTARCAASPSRALTSLGHDVHAFASGADALQALPSLSPVPELLITDVIMPGMNGRVLAERVAALLPDIRVLFVSGYAEDFIVEPRCL